MTANYAQAAALVYQRCNHFDPYLPPLNEDLARAWGSQFERHRLTLNDLLAGVDRVYDQHGSGYRPLPADITAAARAIRRDRDDRQGPSHEYQQLCESKAGDAAELAANRARLQAITNRIGRTPNHA